MLKSIILLAMLIIPFGLYWAASFDSGLMVYLLLGLMGLVMAVALKHA
jgi:hypothetical protein